MKISTRLIPSAAVLLGTSLMLAPGADAMAGPPLAATSVTACVHVTGDFRRAWRCSHHCDHRRHDRLVGFGTGRRARRVYVQRAADHVDERPRACRADRPDRPARTVRHDWGDGRDRHHWCAGSDGPDRPRRR